MIYTDVSPFPYGKYQGEKLENIPASYLLWIYQHHDLSSLQRLGLRDYIEDNLQVLNKQAGENIAKITRD